MFYDILVRIYMRSLNLTIDFPLKHIIIHIGRDKLNSAITYNNNKEKPEKSSRSYVAVFITPYFHHPAYLYTDIMDESIVFLTCAFDIYYTKSLSLSSRYSIF